LQRVGDADRFAAAVRLCGGAAGEMLWQFPMPAHLSRAGKKELLAFWNRMHDKRADEQLLRQLVLTLRTWRPNVVITDHPDVKVTDCPSEALVAEAMHAAFALAADAKSFPEQLQYLGLEAWQPSKMYALWHDRGAAQVAMTGSDFRARLEGSACDFAGEAQRLLAEGSPRLPSQRYFRLVDSKMDGAANHQQLTQELQLSPGGVARRTLAPVAEVRPEVLAAQKARQCFEKIVETPITRLTDPDKLLAQIGPAVKKLPDDQGAAAVLAVANQFVRRGQWTLAREAFLLMVDHYPAHPLSVEAYRWLIRHNSSSEARRRQELGQFVMMTESGPGMPTLPPKEGAKEKSGTSEGSKLLTQGKLTFLRDREETRHWFKGSLELGKRLAAFGALYASDPSIQFCLQADRRHLGEFDAAQDWYAKFKSRQVDGPWREAAAAELWLSNHSGPPPRPLAVCRRTEDRPYLDGKFDDPCWKDVKPLVLQNAVGDTTKEYPTEAWLSYDQQFLYIALRCRHPAEQHVAPVKGRTRDADLRAFDRVSILLDLDRDYSTYFRLEIDQRGCVCEDCWGDRSWNPKWFVAVHSDKDGWQIEAAIPMLELTGDQVTAGTVWACNLVRILPGRGVQGWSLPADVDPRPEGMGLLLFQAGGKETKTNPPSAMPKVP
jgi:hypothetical protein